MEKFLALETQISSARTFFVAPERIDRRIDLQQIYSNHRKNT